MSAISPTSNTLTSLRLFRAACTWSQNVTGLRSVYSFFPFWPSFSLDLDSRKSHYFTFFTLTSRCFFLLRFLVSDVITDTENQSILTLFSLFMYLTLYRLVSRSTISPFTISKVFFLPLIFLSEIGSFIRTCFPISHTNGGFFDKYLATIASLVFFCFSLASFKTLLTFSFHI